MRKSDIDPFVDARLGFVDARLSEEERHRQVLQRQIADIKAKREQSPDAELIELCHQLVANDRECDEFWDDPVDSPNWLRWSAREKELYHALSEVARRPATAKGMQALARVALLSSWGWRIKPGTAAVDRDRPTIITGDIAQWAVAQVLAAVAGDGITVLLDGDE